MPETDVFESAVQRAYDGWASEMATELDAPAFVRATHLGSAGRVEWHRARRDWLTRRHLMVAAGAITAVFVAVIGLASLSGGRPDVGGPPSSTPSPTSAGDTQATPSTGQMTAINGLVDALDARDTEGFISAFAADAILEFPGVDARAGREGDVFMHDQPVHEEDSVEGWMRLLDKWGMEARLGSCRTQSESTTGCAVRTRWHVLRVEIGEEWTFDFDGTRVRRLEMMARVDPDPPNRVLPLGLADLPRWEAWLRETHPEQADRLLPTGPDLFAHYYFRFGLDASPDEIGASIREYVASRP